MLWFHCAALVLYTSITLVYLAPLARRFTTHIAPDPGDPVFNLYLMSWVSDRAGARLSTTSGTRPSSTRPRTSWRSRTT